MGQYYGPSNTDRLLQAIEACLQEWEDDDAYSKPAQGLRELSRELNVLSPGQKAAQNAADFAVASDRAQKVKGELDGLMTPEQRDAARAPAPNQTGHA